MQWWRNLWEIEDDKWLSVTPILTFNLSDCNRTWKPTTTRSQKHYCVKLELVSKARETTHGHPVLYDDLRHKIKWNNDGRNSIASPTVNHSMAPRPGSSTAPGNNYVLVKCSYFICSQGLSGPGQIVFQAPSGHNDQVTTDNYARLSIGLSAKEIHRRPS